MQNLPADFGKLQIGFAGDDVISESSDFLLIGFKAHFWSADNNAKVRANAF